MADSGVVVDKKRAARKVASDGLGGRAYKPSHRPVLAERAGYDLRKLGEATGLSEEMCQDEWVGGSGAEEMEVVDDRNVNDEHGEVELTESDNVSMALRTTSSTSSGRSKGCKSKTKELPPELSSEMSGSGTSELAMMMRFMMERDEQRYEREERKWNIEFDARMEERRRNNDKWEHDSKSKDRKELMIEKLKGLGTYKAGSELSAFLAKFERIMKESGIREIDWPERLYPKLTDKLSERVDVLRDESADYGTIKSALLKAVGETRSEYGYMLWDANSETVKGMSGSEMFAWLKRVLCGVAQGCKSVEEVLLAFGLSFLRKRWPESGKAYLESKSITKWDELRDAMENWVSTREKGNIFRARGSGPYDGARFVRRCDNYGRSGDDYNSGRGQPANKDRVSVENASGWVVRCFNCGERGHKSPECKKGRPVGRGFTPDTVVCFHCGKRCHRSSECREKKVGAPLVKQEKEKTKMSVISVGEVGAKIQNVAMGKVNGVCTEILIDSGAELGSVPRALVPKDGQSVGNVLVRGFDGKEVSCVAVICKFEIGGHCTTVKTIVGSDCQSGVSCIVPFNVTDQSEAKAYTEAIESYRASTSAQMCAMTRAMAKEEKENVNDPDVVCNDLWCSVEPEIENACEHAQEEVPVEASVCSESYVDGDELERVDFVPVPEPATPTVDEDNPEMLGTPTPLEDLSQLPECDEGLKKFVEELEPVGSGSDGSELRKLTLTDESLSTWRSLADKKLRGFSWKDGVLVKNLFTAWEEFRYVVCVPKKFRDKVMTIGHESGGHLSGEKVYEMVKRHFVWPGMAKDILAH